MARTAYMRLHGACMGEARRPALHGPKEHLRSGGPFKLSHTADLNIRRTCSVDLGAGACGTLTPVLGTC